MNIKKGLQLIGQKFQAVNLKKGLAKIYIQEGKHKAELKKIGFVPGTRFKTEVNKDSNEVWFVASNEGYNTVSHREISKKTAEDEVEKIEEKEEQKEIVSVIDKSGYDIHMALKDCVDVTITFFVDENGKGMVRITGNKQTATAIKGEPSEEERPITCMSFCSGSGLSDLCNEKAGFVVKGACEWNPKEGAEDKFAELYAANHPDTIIYNLPMQNLRAEDLPDVDYWFASLDCVRTVPRQYA